MTVRPGRGLPSYVWIAIVGCLGAHFIALLYELVRYGSSSLQAAVNVASNASGIAAYVVVAVAAAQFRRRMTGTARIGMTIAMWAIAASMSVSALATAYHAVSRSNGSPGGEALSYLNWGLGVLAIVGLIVASKRSPALAVVGGILALAHELPPFVWTKIYHGISYDTGLAFAAIWGLTVTTGWVGTLLLLLGASHGTDVPDQRLASNGLRLAASGVWLRVAGAVGGVLVTMMLAFAHSSSNAIIYALVAALIVNMLSFGMFGIGALRASDSHLEGLPRLMLAFAGVLSLWCGSVMYVQAPWLYFKLTGHDTFGSDLLDALSIVQPIVATLGVALFAAAIASFAQHRADAGLARQARSAGVAFVCLMLFSLFLQNVHDGSSIGGLALLLFVAALCGLIAQIALAQLSGAASRSISDEPTVPVAIARTTDRSPR